MNRIFTSLLTWGTAFACFPLWSQQVPDTVKVKVEEINLDLLKTPTNAAFLLMGTSPAEIDEPGSSPEAYISVQNASDNFSALPNNYGMTITPYWWGKRARRLTFEDNFSPQNNLLFYRTLGISAGILQGHGDQPDLWRYALGIRATLLQGRTDTSKIEKYFSHLRNYHEAYYARTMTYYANNEEYVTLEKSLNALMSRLSLLYEMHDAGEISAEVLDQRRIELADTLGKVGKRLTAVKERLDSTWLQSDEIPGTDELDALLNDMNDRKGFKWDAGGGIAMEAPGNKIDSLGIYRIGLWTNFGGQIFSGREEAVRLSAFGLVRYLYYNQVVYLAGDVFQPAENMHMLDTGGKLELEIGGVFSIAAEAVYRTSLSADFYKGNLRLNAMGQYKFSKNRLIYVALGNDFNDASDEGAEDIRVTFGVNIGFGGNVDIYDMKL